MFSFPLFRWKNEYKFNEYNVQRNVIVIAWKFYGSMSVIKNFMCNLNAMFDLCYMFLGDKHLYFFVILFRFSMPKKTVGFSFIIL